jgi:hypothetical protein
LQRIAAGIRKTRQPKPAGKPGLNESHPISQIEMWGFLSEKKKTDIDWV